MKALLTVFFVAIFAFSFAAEKESTEKSQAEATQFDLCGQVMDQKTNELLVGVKVVLEGTDQVAYTDFDGNYKFKNIQTGEYNVTASYISYEKATVKNVELSLEKSQVNISLKLTD